MAKRSSVVSRAARKAHAPEVVRLSNRKRQILLELARGDREIRIGQGHSVDRVLADAHDIIRLMSR